jgi:hypothetical protein
MHLKIPPGAGAPPTLPERFWKRFETVLVKLGVWPKKKGSKVSGRN